MINTSSRAGHFLWPILVCLVLSACAAPAAKVTHIPPPVFNEPIPQDRITVYFHRSWSIIAGGRTYLLEVDKRRIGELTADNFYKAELWPGTYTFSIFFPTEKVLLSTVSLSRPITKTVTFQNTDAGNVYLFSVNGTDHLFHQTTDASPALSGKVLAKSLTAQDTAQVKPPLGTTYDGPVSFGMPSGRGKLAWRNGETFEADFDGSFNVPGLLRYPDGREYIGEFDGRPTGKGVLRDPAGNILFAGRFVKGKPSGQGFAKDDKGPRLREFDATGQEIIQVSRDQLKQVAAKQAAQAIEVEEQSKLNAVMAPVAAIEKKLGEANGARQEQEAAAKRNRAIPAECRCVLSLCLTAERVGGKALSEAQLRLNEKRRAETSRICHKWANSEGEREAEYLARIKQIDAEIDRLSADETRARRQAEEKQRQLQAVLEKSRQERLNSENRKQQELLATAIRQREKREEAAKQHCLQSLARGNRTCDCAPFASDARTWKACTI